MRLYSALMDEIVHSGTTASDGKTYPEVNANTVSRNDSQKTRKSKKLSAEMAC
jgi:hypothetical protein